MARRYLRLLVHLSLSAPWPGGCTMDMSASRVPIRSRFIGSARVPVIRPGGRFPLAFRKRIQWTDGERVASLDLVWMPSRSWAGTDEASRGIWLALPVGPFTLALRLLW